MKPGIRLVRSDRTIKLANIKYVMLIDVNLVYICTAIRNGKYKSTILCVIHINANNITHIFSA